MGTDEISEGEKAYDIRRTTDMQGLGRQGKHKSDYFHFLDLVKQLFRKSLVSNEADHETFNLWSLCYMLQYIPLLAIVPLQFYHPP